MKGYLRGRLNLILFFVVCVLLFAAVFSLYNLNVEAVAYAAVLCGVTGFVFAFVDYSFYRSKSAVLRRIAKEPIYQGEELPSAVSVIEAEYQQIIKNGINQAKHMLAEVDKKKSEAEEFYSMWVHQIKTPIAAMKVLIDSGAERDLLSNELFKIEQYADMALSYVRMKSDNSDYIIKKVKLEKVVKDTVRKYAPLFIQKGLSANLYDLDVEVLTDEKWLAFALEQIVSNGVKYSRHGEIRIYAENNVLTVQDFGSGIAKEDLPRVFERGFTGANGRSGKWSTGIGLYLCRNILEKLGHSIRIESSPGKGTKVFIDLNTSGIRIE